MAKRLFGIILVVLFGIRSQPLASASTLKLEAPKVYARSVTHELRLSSGFTWTLHAGKNQLRVRPRNAAGGEGIPSWIGLEFIN